MRDPLSRRRRNLSAREIEALYRALAQRLARISLRAPAPVAIRLLELGADPGASSTDFARVIRTDAALVARLLSLANSAAAAQRARVTTIERAVVLLGVRRVRAMALGCLVAPALDAGTDALELWSRSVVRAWLAWHLASTFDVDVTGEAFVVGLLLESGVPLMERLLGEPSPAPPGSSPLQRRAIEHENLPFTHTDLVAVLAELWALPERLRTPLVTCHVEPRAIDRADPQSVLHCVAHAVAGIALDDEPPGAADAAPVPAWLEGVDVVRLLDAVRADVTACRDVFRACPLDEHATDRMLGAARARLAA